MRILLVFCICFHLAQCSAQAQEASVFLGSQQPPTQQPALQQPAPQRTVPQQTELQQPALQRAVPPVPQQAKPQSTAPQQGAPQQGAPESDPFKDDPAPSQPDNLDLDSTRGFNFDDSANTPFSNPSDFQSSVASNSNFSGASPQMIGDFGGGSLIKTIGGGTSNILTFPIPLAGGSRRIKIAENNQVMPEDRIYGTFNYFHNANQAIGSGPNLGDPVTVVDSESLAQYTVGMEKTFCVWGTPFSIDVRMPFTGGVSQFVDNYDSNSDRVSKAEIDTGSMGNLSTALKVYLLEVKQTSISGGLGMSLPTGSPAHAVTTFDGDYFGNVRTFNNYLDVDNSAVHLMPFLGAYRQMGDSCWLQAFTQIDVPTGGNRTKLTRTVDVVPNGSFVVLDSNEFRIEEQTLLYADVSFGKWWYRNVHECGRAMCTNRERGLTGIASVLELHYTGSLNDADPFLSQGLANQFNVLNLTTGLTVELNEQLRINLAGVFPLRERGLDANGRREDRFFDSEVALQMNYFF